MKIFKWFVVLLTAALMGTVALSAGGWWMMRGRPEWYGPDQSTPEQRRVAAAAAENKLIAFFDWMSDSRATAVRREKTAGASPSTAQVSALAADPARPAAITFTDQELNAFFNKWADVDNRRELYERYIDDPRLVLRDQQLIIAGTVKELGLIVSMQFQPRIDEQGNLQMNLVHVLGGMLPLPDAMWAGQRAKVEAMLQTKLRPLQRQANIKPDGVANGAAGAVAMNKLLWSILHDRAANPVIFLPFDITDLGRCLPVKVTDVQVKDHAITLTAEQLPAGSHAGLLAGLRAPYPDADPAKTAVAADAGAAP